MPKRSASSTTITVAFGTSTPTSMTVVATRTSSVAGPERAHHGLLLGRRHAPVQQAEPEAVQLAARQPLERLLRRGDLELLGLLDQRAHDVRLAARRRPRRAPPPTRPPRPHPPPSVVTIGVRPGGSSSRTLTSRSPYTVIAAVRGIGVAVITSTSGTAPPALSRRAARCSTPKRCCSSIDDDAEAAERDALLDQGVGADHEVDRRRRPARRAAACARCPSRGSSAARRAAAARRTGCPRRPAPRGRRAGRGSRPRAARRAPPSAPSARPGARPARRRAARSTATTVLPEPTSPCSSRCIGCGAARSASISPITRCWAFVSGNGRASWKRRTSSPPTAWRMPTESRSIARLRITSTSCTRNSSSNASRRRACSFSWIVSGRWMPRSAVQRSMSDSRRRTRSGTGSARPRGRHFASASSTHAGDLPRVQLGLLALRVDRHDAPGAVADQVDDRVRHLQAAAERRRPCRTGRSRGPASSWRSRHGWLKNTTCRRPESSPTTASTIERRLRSWRFFTERTVDEHERRRAGHEVAHPRLVRAVDPAPGVRRQQVEHRRHADGGERLGLLLADALHARHRDGIEVAERQRQRPATGGLLDAEEERVQRLAAVVDLDLDTRAVRLHPRLDRGERAVVGVDAADDRHQLAVVTDEAVEQGGRGRRRRRARRRRCRRRGRCPASRPRRPVRPASGCRARPA